MTVGEIQDALYGVDRDTEIIVYNYDDDLVDVSNIKIGVFGVLKNEYKNTGKYIEIRDRDDMQSVESDSEKTKVLITYQ